MPVKESRIAANGMEFGLLEAGDGPLALLLHGFPDHARSWTGLIERLAAEGYRAVAHQVFLAISDVQQPNAGTTPRRDVNDAANRKSEPAIASRCERITPVGTSKNHAR